MSDWIKLHRSLNDNPLWLLEPFTKAQAWVDLCLNANWKNGSFSVRGNIVDVGRGQIGWSELTMADRWKWSRDKVRRFLSYLERSGNIRQQKTHITSIITICNYSVYQGDDATDKTTDKTTEKQQKNNRRDTIEEGKEGKEGKVKESKGSFETASVSNPGFSQDFMGRVWPFYLKTGKAKYKNTDSQSVALRTLYKEAGGNEQEAIDALQYAVANGYQGFQWYFKHKSKTNGHEQRNGTLGYQQPITAADLPDIMQSIADDPRYG
ncbi:MAG: hypothetical protein HGA87_01385 [Desulfobulbaceae bacterium]|nr:hypothetical protein [Desulfobulbaceae bacterium]